MKQLTILITVLQVFAHSVFGCCAHGDVIRTDAAPPTCCQHALDCGRHDVQFHPSAHGEDVAAADEANDSQPPTHRREHQCPHDACQWIIQKAAGPSVDFSMISYLPGLPYAADYIVAAPLDLIWRADFPPAAHPVRLHLWVGVLLI
jgi:hypothetical protein